MARKYMIYEVRYNKEQDAFETWLAVTEGYYPKKEDFGLELSCPCVESKECDEKNFIHFEILKAISRAYHLGYEIDYRI